MSNTQTQAPALKFLRFVGAKTAEFVPISGTAGKDSVYLRVTQKIQDLHKEIQKEDFVMKSLLKNEQYFAADMMNVTLKAQKQHLSELLEEVGNN